MPLEVPRAVLEYTAKVVDERISDNAVVERIIERAIAQLRSKVSTFQRADYALRYLLYRVYVGESDFLRAAGMLAAAHLDAAVFTDVERATAYIRIAQNYLKGDDDVNAERYLRRAGDVPRLDVFELTVQYRMALAQVADCKRKFLEGALRYLDVMRLVASAAVAEEEVADALCKAAKCAILGPAGPQRQRVMGTLMRDERLHTIPPAVFAMLDRMYRERIIVASDATAFAATLAPHQRAVGADGFTVVQRALIEHNIKAAGKVYKAVSFATLAGITGIEAARVERIAAKMVSERRLAATLDQLDGMLEYAAGGGGGGASTGGALAVTGGGSAVSAGSGGGGVPAASSGAGVESLLVWDDAIKAACLRLNATVEDIVRAHPTFAPA